MVWTEIDRASTAVPVLFPPAQLRKLAYLFSAVVIVAIVTTVAIPIALRQVFALEDKTPDEQTSDESTNGAEKAESG